MSITQTPEFESFQIGQRHVAPANDIWFTRLDDHSVNIGFTESFLTEIRDEAWNIITNDASYLKRGQPLFAVETNDSLTSIVSPFDGRVSVNHTDFNALNSFEKLTSDRPVVRLFVGKQKKPAAPTRPTARPAGNATDAWAIEEEIQPVLEWERALERAQDAMGLGRQVDAPGAPIRRNPMTWNPVAPQFDRRPTEAHQQVMAVRVQGARAGLTRDALNRTFPLPAGVRDQFS